MATRDFELLRRWRRACIVQQSNQRADCCIAASLLSSLIRRNAEELLDDCVDVTHGQHFQRRCQSASTVRTNGGGIGT